ncbi:MAG: molybdate ABC transporter substrate-binding protein, partial [Chloroflexi bacterium RBG_16_57_9]
TEIGAAFEQAHPGVDVAFNFAGSQQLRAQLEQGARADVFATAHSDEMESAWQKGLVLAGTERVFAHNRLLLIYPRSNPGNLAALPDLARPGLKLVVAGKNVPVGKYTREALARMSQDAAFGHDFAEKVLRNVVSEEDNVRQVVAKVRLGEADAGFVYVSDVGPSVRPAVSTLAIPDTYNTVATYLIATLAESAQPDLAQRFVDFVLSPTGQTILERHGLAHAK